ncbi:class I SAM-dependent methyltransferase [bacterium]|nr:class I SAM-dependent methyltransferase [bacterium]
MTTHGERPLDRASWEQRYTDGDLPWDTGEPDGHLRGVIEHHDLAPCRALEIGCGTGTNAIWLAQQGFDVTGMDLSPTAIASAEAKRATLGVRCGLVAGDFLTDDLPRAPYEFVYDRGCFHIFDDVQARAGFASRVGELLAPEGVWHSLIGSTDGPPRDAGPPRRSAAAIIAAIEPHFEILELTSTSFDRERHSEARAWVLVARRRVV